MIWLKNFIELSEDEIKAVYRARVDERTAKFCLTRFDFAEHCKFIESLKSRKDKIYFMVYEDERFIGVIDFIDICENSAEFGLYKNPEVERVESVLMCEMLRYASEKLKLSRLTARVLKSNATALALYDKFGFAKTREEGEIVHIKKNLQFKFETTPRKNVIALSNALYKNTAIYGKENFIYIEDRAELTRENLAQIDPEFVFLPHWSYIVPRDIYENFNCVIFHMTDLPFGRGGSPLQNLLVRGIRKTKISAIKCTAELDAGDVYLKRDFDISRGSAEQIYKRMGGVIAKMIDFILVNRPKPTPQSGEIVKFARRKPEQSELGGQSELVQIYDFIRMLDAPGYPKAFLQSGDFKFEISGAKSENGKITANVEIRKKDE